MPELAEVALFARDLNQGAKGRQIQKVSFPNQKDWGSKIVPAKVRRILLEQVGNKIFFGSSGKALFICNNEKNPILEFRLGMTGQFHIERQSGHWRRHYFLSVFLDGWAFHFADPRRFGRITFPQNKGNSLGGFTDGIGFRVEPDISVPSGYLTRPKIAWLLSFGDQTGVGNYMANEALGLLGMSPFTPCKNLKEAQKLLKECGRIASMSYQRGGHSFGSGFYRLNGEEGKYSKLCRFYKNPDVPRVMFGGRPVYSHFSI